MPHRSRLCHRTAPAAIRDALIGEERVEFEWAYRDALAEAAETLDLTRVLDVVRTTSASAAAYGDTHGTRGTATASELRSCSSSLMIFDHVLGPEHACEADHGGTRPDTLGASPGGTLLEPPCSQLGGEVDHLVDGQFGGVEEGSQPRFQSGPGISAGRRPVVAVGGKTVRLRGAGAHP